MSCLVCPASTSCDVLTREAAAAAKVQEAISSAPVDLDPELVDEFLAAGITASADSNGVGLGSGSLTGSQDDAPDPLQVATDTFAIQQLQLPVIETVCLLLLSPGCMSAFRWTWTCVPALPCL